MLIFSCANPSDEGSMVEVTRNFRLSYGTFQFRSYVWRNNSEDPIYLHCSVDICDNLGNDCGLLVCTDWCF